jgi:hypothetical protein
MFAAALFAPDPHFMSGQAAQGALVHQHARIHVPPGIWTRKHDHQTHTRSPALQDPTNTAHNAAVNAAIVRRKALMELGNCN